MEGMAWQPIETAPKDGTECLIAYRLAEDESTYEVGVGVFDDDPDGIIWTTAGLSTRPISDWSVHPDFWMPLPDPPSE